MDIVRMKLAAAYAEQFTYARMLEIAGQVYYDPAQVLAQASKRSSTVFLYKSRSGFDGFAMVGLDHPCECFDYLGLTLVDPRTGHNQGIGTHLCRHALKEFSRRQQRRHFWLTTAKPSMAAIWWKLATKVSPNPMCPTNCFPSDILPKLHQRAGLCGIVDPSEPFILRRYAHSRYRADFQSVEMEKRPSRAFDAFGIKEQHGDRLLMVGLTPDA
jgi:hypothetical protein